MPSGRSIGSQPPAGSDATRNFYDREGWVEEDGVLKDADLFGTHEDGPIRKAAHARRMERLLGHLRGASPPLDLIECGCGGSPEPALLPLCRSYTGVDFSTTGIEAARATLSNQSAPFELVVGDICRLPFPDGAFDAAYSAHAIYHIPDAAAQAAALTEAARVTRPGGVVVFLLANPYPLLFPVRLARRIAAQTPQLNRILGAMRPKPPLPYLPMPIGWMTERLAPFGKTTVETHSMASTWFNQNVSETGGVGRAAWRLLERLEQRHPVGAARLGNYVLIVVNRT